MFYHVYHHQSCTRDFTSDGTHQPETMHHLGSIKKEESSKLSTMKQFVLSFHHGPILPAINLIN